jgi:predicted nucleic acid-binding protein
MRQRDVVLAMKPKVYIETSVLSYLTARPSRDAVVAGNQATTRDWWERRAYFDLYISVFVLEESRMGDPLAVEARMLATSAVPEIAITPDVALIADGLLSQASLPAKARLDALHIAAATLGGMDYLLTWNCTHIANPAFRPKIEALIRAFGYEPPVICTPQELIEV